MSLLCSSRDIDRPRMASFDAVLEYCPGQPKAQTISDTILMLLRYLIILWSSCSPGGAHTMRLSGGGKRIFKEFWPNIDDGEVGHDREMGHPIHTQIHTKVSFFR